MIEVQVLVTGNLVQFRISYQKWSLTSRGFTDGSSRFSVPKNIKRISEGTCTKISTPFICFRRPPSYCDGG